MGLFEKLFKRPEPSGNYDGFFKTLTAYTPVFTTFSGSIYESELIRSAIHARANHISKLKVGAYGTAQPVLQTRVKVAPNEFQTWGQFLYRLSTILDVQNTAFIVPVLDEYGRINGYYPLLPSQCSVVQYKEEPWLRYKFANGNCAAIELHMCGVMTKFQYEDDFFGSSNNALVPTMNLVAIQNQGIEESVKSAATYRFMAQVNNFTKPDDLAKERKNFTAKNLAGDGGGLLLFPNTYTNIQQIKNSPFVVDADQMKSIKENVYTYFGVNDDVLQNKAFGDAWNAFYEGAIEPFAIQFSDVITRMTYTDNEITRGSGIMATANRLQYMSNTDKLNVSAQMSDRGLMMIDEVREIWNLPPLPNNEGQVFPIRGEYYLRGENTGKEGNDNGQ